MIVVNPFIYNIQGNAEVDAWEAEIIGAGGTVSGTTLDAAVQFMDDISAFRTKIIRFNPFASDSLAGALCPLINTVDGVTLIGNAKDTNNNFVSGDFSESGGLGNAANSTKYIATSIVPSAVSEISHLKLGIGIWSLTNKVDQFDMGSWGAVGQFYINARLSGLLRSVYADVVSTETVSDSLGMSAWSQLNSLGTRVLQKNGTTYTKSDGNILTTKSTKEIRVFNLEGVGWSTTKMAGYFISNGMTGTDLTDLYNAWNTFNSAIGR